MQRLVFGFALFVVAHGCSSDERSPGGQAGAVNAAGAGAGGSGQSGSAGSATGGGISANFPGDVGIESDPHVIFADDFESYTGAADLWQRWDNVFQLARTRIAVESDNVYAGKQALEFTLPQMTNELSNAVQKVLTNELDAMYLRFHSKFDTTFDIVGSSHNGGGMSAHYSTPGVPANGSNKFLVEFEAWRGEAASSSPGQLNLYVYHPEQRDDYGDHFFPTGVVLPNTSLPFDFGPDFVSRPDVTPELGRWYAYELFVRANTPGQRDGRITIWLDGELIGDFPNLRFRDVDTLTLDRFNLSFHARSNSAGETKKWYDNVVAATAYIGPMVAQ
jgi:hypothetical protein